MIWHGTDKRWRLWQHWRLRAVCLVAALLFCGGWWAVAVFFMREPFAMELAEKPPLAVTPSPERPAPLTARELEYQRWLSAITWQLPRERWGEQWNMAGKQFDTTSYRYPAAFAGYAAAALGMRTPAYTGVTRRVLRDVIERLIDRQAWAYSATYWKDTFPDPAAQENVMFTGHLLQLLALYEAMTGDDHYRTEGFDFIWDAGKKTHYNTLKLAEVSARQMRDNPSGGIACEPGLIFFACNNHPQTGLALLENMRLGAWTRERRKWEAWALGSFRAVAGDGLFRLLYHPQSGAFAPIGLPGGDGWALLWYVPWAANERAPRELWRQAKKKFTLAALLPDRFTPEVSPGEFSCCGDHVSLSISNSFLAAAARACGDPATAQLFEAWLDRHFLRRQDGQAFLAVEPAWRISATANRILALAQENGSNLREMIQAPLPRDYFRGPLLLEVKPATMSVAQAYREGNKLIVELVGDTRTASLRLGNVSSVSAVEGLDRAQWRFADGVLHVNSPGQRILRIVSPEAKTAPLAVR